MSGLRVLLCTMMVLAAASARAEDTKVPPPAPVTEAALRPAGDPDGSGPSLPPVLKASLPERPAEPARRSVDPGLDQDEGAGIEQWLLEYGRTLGRAE
jgi:hypothetical protein